MASNNISSRDAELLSAYIDNELSLEERAALEVRIDRDPALAQELAELQDVADMVRTLPVLVAPRNFTLTAEMLAERDRARAAAATVLIFPTTTLFSALTGAAATILIIFGALAVFVTANQGMAPQSADVAYESESNPFSGAAQQPASTVLPFGNAQQAAAPTSTPSPLPTQAAQDELRDQTSQAESEFFSATALFVPADDAQMTATQFAQGQLGLAQQPTVLSQSAQVQTEAAGSIPNIGDGVIIIATAPPSTATPFAQDGPSTEGNEQPEPPRAAVGGEAGPGGAGGAGGVADTDTSAAELQVPPPESTALTEDDAAFDDESVVVEEMAEAEEEAAAEDSIALDATDTSTPAPTATVPPTGAALRSSPLSTSTVIARLIPQPTQAAAPPSAPPQQQAVRETETDVNVALIIAGAALLTGAALLAIAIITTVARRRRRGRR